MAQARDLGANLHGPAVRLSPARDASSQAFGLKDRILGNLSCDFGPGGFLRPLPLSEPTKHVSRVQFSIRFSGRRPWTMSMTSAPWCAILCACRRWA